MPRVRPIFLDSLAGKEHFLRFWKLPFSTERFDEPALSIIHGGRGDSGFREVPDHALVQLSSPTPPVMSVIDETTHIFARIRRLESVPAHLEVVAHIRDKEGKRISYITRDARRQIIYLPFYIDEVIRGFQAETYITARKTSVPKNVSNLYYWLRPGLPMGVRMALRRLFAKAQERRAFPRWPIEGSLEDFKRYILGLILSVSRSERLPMIWFWPDRKGSCLILTHDVETGLADNPGIDRLLEVEHRLGFNSSFNIVPFKYPVDRGAFDRLRLHGCEIGVHGFSHDGKLFSSWPVFQERLASINRIARQWGATGFRSASTYRNPHWLDGMDFEYDSSFFDTDPYEPQPGGSLSLFPFFFGDCLELPVTMVQDHTIFNILGQRDTKIWEEKAAAVAGYNGMITMLTHPDQGYIGDEDKIGHYSSFLETLEDRATIWHALPREVARWWRRRDRARLELGAGEPRIIGGDDSMKIAWAAKTAAGLVWE